MNPTVFYTLPLTPFRLWSTFAWKAGEMMLASAQVIGHRSALSADALSSTEGRRELALMGQEKIAAAAESGQAIVVGWMGLAQQFSAIAFRQLLTGTAAMMSLAASRTPEQSVARRTKLVSGTMTRSAVVASQLSKSTARVAHRGLKPILSRATRNAKRLGKRK